MFYTNTTLPFNPWFVIKELIFYVTKLNGSLELSQGCQTHRVLPQNGQRLEHSGSEQASGSRGQGFKSLNFFLLRFFVSSFS